MNVFFAAKDESKSPVRTSGRISVTAPPSRKTSTANNVSILIIAFGEREMNDVLKILHLCVLD